MTDDRIEISSSITRRSQTVLNSVRKKSILDFSYLVKNNIIQGKWDDNYWKHPNGKITFYMTKKQTDFMELAEAKEKTTFEPEEIIIKSLITSILCEKKRISTISQTMSVFRVFTEHVNNTTYNWSHLNKITFNRIQKEISSLFPNKNTYYHKMVSLIKIRNHLNEMHAFIDGKPTRFLVKPISWTNNEKNPSKKIYDITSEQRKSHLIKKYPNGLEVAIAKLRLKLDSNDYNEPKLGCYSLRVSALLPCLALGLRVGEVTTLHRNALQYDDRTESYFLDAWTEKTEKVIPRPIPSLWQDVFIKEFAEISKICTSARERAKIIEDDGFLFIKKKIIDKRLSLPVNEDFISITRYLGLAKEDVCTIDELTSTFDVGRKQFTQEGLYSSCARELPPITAIRLINWLDARVENNDIRKYFTPIYGGENKGKLHISRRSICTHSGTLSGNATNIPWLKYALNEIYTRLEEGGIFSHYKFNSHKLPKKELGYISSTWSEIKENLVLNKVAHKKSIVIFSELEKFLSMRYQHKLSQHYQEFVHEKKTGNHTIKGNNYIKEQPLSDHLFVIWDSQFNPTHDSLGLMPRPMTRNDIYNLLSEKSNKRTVFEIFNITDNEGKHFSFHPHQIRHWVTTAMLRSGYNEELVDLLLGRSPGQTRHYDHRSGVERAKHIRDKAIYSSATPPNDWLGAKVLSLRERNYSESEIERLIQTKLKILHFTPWGQCSRDLTIMPCTKALSCIKGFGGESGCTHFHIDENDQVAKAAIQDLLKKHKSLLIALEPNYSSLKESFDRELGSSSEIDQHLLYVLDIIKGCENALSYYEVKNSL